MTTRAIAGLRRVRAHLAAGWAGVRGRGDEGRAIVEFVFLGVLLLIPLVYLVLTAARLQAAAFSASLAGRESGRAYVTATDDADGRARAEAAARLAFTDFGFDTSATLSVDCDGAPCLRPDGAVTSTASIAVALPLIPDFVSDRVPTSITITSTYVATVDRFVAR